jgi:hypothetical protein
MLKKTFTFCFLFVLLLNPSLFSQYNTEISAGKAPWIPQNTNLSTRFTLINPYTTGFAYSSSGSTSQLFRFKVSTPGTTTLIGTTQTGFLGNGDFANPTGVWKFYVQEQLAAPYTIYEVDTATGVLTSVGAPNNLKPGHMPIDMEWDHTTNTMYMVSANNTLTETQFYSMYWPTKTLTWVGSPVTVPAAIIAGGFNANGTYFGTDLTSDALWKVNKNTGVWTQVGLLGYNVNYGQDAGFDRTDFSKMLWSACGGTVGLYEVDTATGSSSQIGTFPYTQVLATGYAAPFGPQISHTPLTNTTNVAGPYVINAVVTPGGSGIKSTKLYWSRNNTAITDSVTMTNSSGLNWTGSFPGNGTTATYRYYLWTIDSLNRVARAPVNAPSSLYTFIAMATDTIKPVIIHAPIDSAYQKDWPVSVTATVTDNFGVDSVWVKWRKNSTQVKQFRLNNTTGSTYTAVFNSLNSDVLIGDTIYYRIFAQDNSPLHNRDSSVLFSCKIIVFPYACIGTGTVQISNGSPFNTYWMGSRTQMLYTASEISANSGVAGIVNKIGFNIYQSSSQLMNGFNINMQNITSPTLTGFVNSNWTNVYTGTFSIPGTGWRYINLQTPFYWDGTSNLLIEVCFTNTSYTTASIVLGTTISGMLYTEYHDQTNACAYNAPNAISSRPNICMQITPVNGIIPNNGNIPVNYKLSQNYPNPFNPVTRISFDIPKQGFVSLKIYDVLGREVKSLVSEVKSPGSYSVDFNAAGLSSGLYLYRLESNSFIDTKRMVLIK